MHELAELDLETRWLGRQILFQNVVDSTNVWAASLGDSAEHGAVFIADAQTAGRGRLGRVWQSPEGVNLYFSVVLRPTWHPARLPPLSLAAAVAVSQALDVVFGQAPRVKWPNDVFYGDQKVAGILTELSADVYSVRRVIVGVGINVNQHQFCNDLQGSATSLARVFDCHCDRRSLLIAIMQHLEHWLGLALDQQSEAIVAAWSRHGFPLNCSVRIRAGDALIQGHAVRVAPNGALVVRGADGTERPVLSGTIESIESIRD